MYVKSNKNIFVIRKMCLSHYIDQTHFYYSNRFIATLLFNISDSRSSNHSAESSGLIFPLLFLLSRSPWLHCQYSVIINTQFIYHARSGAKLTPNRNNLRSVSNHNQPLKSNNSNIWSQSGPISFQPSHS